MNVTVVVLLIIGIICIAVSYVISDKASNNKEEELVRYAVIGEDYELTQAEKRLIREKVSEAIADYADHIVTETEEELSRQSNEKMLALGDYAVTVYEEIETNHKEVMFLYSMLNDKQKEIVNLVSDIDKVKQNMQDHMLNMKNNENVNNDAIKIKNQKNNNDIDNKENDITYSEDEYDEEFKDIDSMDVDFDSVIEEIEEEDNINQIILELHKSGMNMIEIAKQLGLGVGEVKLVVDLYQGE